MSMLSNQDAQELLIEAVDLNNELTHDKVFHRVARSIAGLIYRSTKVPYLMSEVMFELNPDVSKDVLESIYDTYDWIVEDFATSQLMDITKAEVLERLSPAECLDQFSFNAGKGHGLKSEDLPSPEIMLKVGRQLGAILSTYDLESFIASLYKGHNS